MSGVSRAVSQIAGIVATVAMFIPGGQPVAAAAAAVAAVSGAIATLTQKPPEAKGALNESMIGANMPIIYTMGRTYSAGAEIYDNSNGGLERPERTLMYVGTHGGPIEKFEEFQFDYTNIGIAASGNRLEGAAGGFYSGFLWVNSRLGLRPDTALTQVAGMTAGFNDWGTPRKLSGMAAWSVTMKFDKDAKRYASGIPTPGMVAKWVWAYDPRLDSTYPGGSGPQRWDDELTWTWSENPGLHALTYARGRFMGPNNVKVVGMGTPKASIDIPFFVSVANLCDANGWTLGGSILEGPGVSKWNNLKLILDAAVAKPAWVGGKLTGTYSAPQVSLDTVTKDDLLDGDEPIPAMKSWKEKFNTIVGRYRSEDHKWEHVQAGAVINATYLAEDGEPKTDERQYDLIQNVNQCAQRAGYDLVDEREYGPFSLPLKPRLRKYRPGQSLDLDLASMFDDPGMGVQQCKIVGRTIEPLTGAVTLDFVSETATKHAWALGQVGVAPPTPTIVPPDVIDQAVAGLNLTTAQLIAIIKASVSVGLTVSLSPTGDLTVSNHTRRYADIASPVAVTGTAGTPIATGATLGQYVFVFYDDQTRAGGAVTYQYLVLPTTGGDASATEASQAHPYRHYVWGGKVAAATTGGGSDPGSGGGGSGPCVTTDTLIAMADGSTKPAGDLVRYDQILTQPEMIDETGAISVGAAGIYHVTRVEIVEAQPVFRVEHDGKVVRATADHRLWIDGAWQHASDLGTADGTADVVKISVVAEAQTYVSGGLLSHNLKPAGVE